jgi:hypothetical protein
MNFFSISGGDLNGALSNGRGHSTSVSSPAKPAATAALATAAATPGTLCYFLGFALHPGP